jgi:hypothetical protein
MWLFTKFRVTENPVPRDLSVLDAVACRKMQAMHTYTVALRIQSRDLDPAQITRELGLTPTQTRAVGGHRSADKVWDKALWELEVFPQDDSHWGSLETGLASLLMILAHHKKQLQEYGRKHEVFIWCGHFSSSFDGGPCLSAEILRALGDFGFPLWLDTYFSDGEP